MKPTKLLYISGLAISFLLGWIFSLNYYNQFEGLEKSTTSEIVSQDSKVENASHHTEVPEYVYEVWEYVLTHDEAPAGYVGGRRFHNRERLLPLEDKYKEWDVHPKVKGKNRGAERLVTSHKGDGYYTSDHYRSFTKIN